MNEPTSNLTKAPTEEEVRKAALAMPDSQQYLIDRIVHLEKEVRALESRLSFFEDPGASRAMLMREGMAQKFTDFLRKEILDPAADGLYDRIVDGIREIFGYDRVGVMIYDEERDLIMGHRSIGLPEEYIKGLRISPRETEGDKMRNYVAAAFSSGMPLLVSDRCRELAFNTRRGAPHKEYSSQYAVVPICGKTRTFGILTVAISEESELFLTDADLLILGFFATQAAVVMENKELSASIDEFYRDLILTFSNLVEIYDDTTSGHCNRLISYARALGEVIGLSPSELRELELAAALHDIGKLAVPSHVLNKPGKLTAEEYEEVKKHTLFGADMVAPLKRYTRVLEAVRHHHERWDGNGYPDGHSGEKIPLFGRIIGLVDAFDVMTSTRPYKSPRSFPEAVEEILRCAGSHFDPRLASHFVALDLEKIAVGKN